VGVRILTQTLDPAVFGVASLVLGVAALALGLTCTPLTQAAMYFYPSLAAEGRGTILRKTLWRAWRKTLPWVIGGGLILAVPYVVGGTISIWLVLATAALLFADTWRSINLCLLNVASEHKRYGIWLTLEAWGRPLAATAAVVLVSRSAEAVLWAYTAVSLLLNLSLSGRSTARLADLQNEDLRQRMWQYALPLVPQGLLGWANGMSNRYMIGGMLSLHETGIYAAAYGLASRPLLLVNTAFEQFMRPIYQNAVSAGRTAHAAKLLRYWLASLAATCAVAVLVTIFWSHQLAHLLLGPSFRSGADLIPWVAAGYGVLSLAYVFERVCLAHGHPRRVLLVESLSGVSAVVLTVAGVHAWGLTGAAVAVPLYFGVQLCAAFALSRQTRRSYQYRPT